MAYGIWCVKLNKWMIDGYDRNNKPIVSLFKLRREAASECEILNRDWYRHPRAGMKFKIIEDYVPKAYRKQRKKTK